MRETFNAHGHTNTRTTCIGNYNPIYPRMWSIDGIMHPSFRRTQRDCSNGLKRSSKKKARTHTHTHTISNIPNILANFPKAVNECGRFFLARHHVDWECSFAHTLYYLMIITISFLLLLVALSLSLRLRNVTDFENWIPHTDCDSHFFDWRIHGWQSGFARMQEDKAQQQKSKKKKKHTQTDTQQTHRKNHIGELLAIPTATACAFCPRCAFSFDLQAIY